MNKELSIPPLHLCPTLEIQSQNEVRLADISEATVREMVVNIRKAHEKMAETAEKVSNSKKIDQDTEQNNRITFDIATVSTQSCLMIPSEKF